MTLRLRVSHVLAIRHTTVLTLVVLAALMVCAGQALAHNVTPGDAGYIQEIWGAHLIPFMYCEWQPESSLILAV